MLLYIVLAILLMSTIICFGLFMKCVREKHNSNYENIINLSERICELEFKLNSINSKLSDLNIKK